MNFGDLAMCPNFASHTCKQNPSGQHFANN